jgi:hypothetical protein
MKIISEEEITIRCSGTLPLLMARGELANPFDEWSQKSKSKTSKKEKTLEDLREIGQLQFCGHLYFDEQIGPIIPTDNIFKCLQQAAAKRKKAGLIKSSVLIEGVIEHKTDVMAAKLCYSGPRTLEGLWGEGISPFVHQMMGKIPKTRISILITRPVFPTPWHFEFIAKFDPTMIERRELLEIIEIAGWQIGIGAWRPKYGRFSIETLS